VGRELRGEGRGKKIDGRVNNTEIHYVYVSRRHKATY
jgi:hypothetical protein